MLARFGDYLMTVESSLDGIKRSGLAAIARTFGTNGKPSAGPARTMFNSHRKRFDRDMSRFLRYSSLTALYSLFETTARNFIQDFDRTYPGKRQFKSRKPPGGFVKHFRQWLETSPPTVLLDEPRIWNHLDDFRVIRNCVTHANGDLFLTDNASDVSRVVGRTRKVRFDSKGLLVLDQEFVFEASERVDAFFRLLFRACGYGMALPPDYIEKFQKSFAGYERQMAEAMAAYDKRQTINLGGQL